MRVLRPQDDEARGPLIGDLPTPRWDRVHPCELTPVPSHLFTHPTPDLFVYRVVPDLRRPVLRHPRHTRLGREPVARAIHVEVRGTIGQTTECVPEGRHTLAGLDAAELDPSVVDPLVRHLQRRCTPHEEGAGHTAGGRVPAEVRVLPVLLEGEGLGAVDIVLDDGDPIVLEVAGQLGLDRVRVYRDTRGEDQQAPVLTLPELVDHRRHQAEYAAGTLEAVE